MRPAFLLALILIPCPLSGAAAQLSRLEAGERVRLHLNRESGATGDGTGQLVGEVLAVTADSLRLQIHPDASPVSVAISSLKRLDLSRGVPSAASSALRMGALLGYVVAVQFPISDLEEEEGNRFGSVREGMLIGAAAGSAVGLVLGALIRPEAWDRLALPHESAPHPDAVLFPRVAMTGGWGWASGAGGSGDGAYARLGVGLVRIGEGAHLRGELMYHQAALEWKEAAPPECEQADNDYCLHRGEETRRFGAGIAMILPLGRIRNILQFYAPFGLGVVHSRVATEEVEGCIVGGQPSSCADGPALERLQYTRNAVGAAVNGGLGLSVQLGEVSVFAEFRGQVMDEDSHEPAQFAPIAIGLSF